MLKCRIGILTFKVKLSLLFFTGIPQSISSTFYARFFVLKTFSTYVLALKFFLYEKGSRKMLLKSTPTDRNFEDLRFGIK